MLAKVNRAFYSKEEMELAGIAGRKEVDVPAL